MSRMLCILFEFPPLVVYLCRGSLRPLKQVALESYLEEVRSQLADLKFTKPKNNLSPAERKALKALKGDTEINIRNIITVFIVNNNCQFFKNQFLFCNLTGEICLWTMLIFIRNAAKNAKPLFSIKKKIKLFELKLEVLYKHTICTGVSQ